MIGNKQTPAPTSRVNGFLAVFVFIMAIYMVFTQIWPRVFFGTAGARPIDPRGDLMEIEKTTTQIFQHVGPSVVFVTNAKRRTNRRTQEVFSVPSGSGSGFIWDDRGHIVTNYHVIEGADRIIITTANKNSYDAVVVGFSREDDLAVLRIGSAPAYLNPIPIGTSSDLKVGQEIFAIGNPFGFDQTLTRGIVSALHRDLPQQNGVVLHDLIQTDAAINPGNSGGPLLDSAGRLIGVATAIISPSNASAGIGFAIPVDRVNELIPQLIEHGRAVKPIFGVNLGMGRYTIDGEQRTGVRFNIVHRNTPAAKAGLLGDHREGGYTIRGEILLAIDDLAIPDISTFNEVMTQYEIGDTVMIRVLSFTVDSVTEREVRITFAAGPDG